MKKLRIALCLALALGLGIQAAAHSAPLGFAEGLAAYQSKNFSVAFKELQPLAAKGHADSQNLLGLMYYTGQGVAQDYKKAAPWLDKAAKQGNGDAQYVLGAMYYTGKGVPQDYKAAVTWFRKAAEKGRPEAQHLLGLMYQHGAGGVPRDPVLAYMLWNLAATAGMADAVEMRANAVKRMSQEQVEEGQAMSAGWKVGTPLPLKSRTGVES